MTPKTRRPRCAVLALARVSMLALAATAEASPGMSSMPMAFAGGDLVTNLKEFGEEPVRTVSCVGAQGSGKSTLMRTMFGKGASNLALLEARSSAAYVPETSEFETGAGQAMVSLAVSDATIYNVLVHDLRRPDAMSDVQVGAPDYLHVCVGLHQLGDVRINTNLRCVRGVPAVCSCFACQAVLVVHWLRHCRLRSLGRKPGAVLDFIFFAHAHRRRGSPRA